MVIWTSSSACSTTTSSGRRRVRPDCFPRPELDGGESRLPDLQSGQRNVEIERFEPQTFLADGDRVIVLGDDTARVKATGKVLTERWAHAFTLKNGKIVAFEEYMDTSAVVAELRAAHAST